MSLFLAVGSCGQRNGVVKSPVSTGAPGFVESAAREDPKAEDFLGLSVLEARKKLEAMGFSCHDREDADTGRSICADRTKRPGLLSELVLQIVLYHDGEEVQGVKIMNWGIGL